MNENLRFASQAICDNYIKLAIVDLKTGTFEFLKEEKGELEQLCLKTSTIHEYTQMKVDYGLIHPEDAHKCLSVFGEKHLKSMLQTTSHISHSYRYKLGDNYEWITFEVIIPKDFCQENQEVIFTWRKADNQINTLEDALNALSDVFYRILKINLTSDTYECIKGEKFVDGHKPPEYISDWFIKFADLGNVHEDDKTGYYIFTNINYLRKQFYNGATHLVQRYRRKVGNSYRWVTMELVPSVEYTHENQIVLLYIKDVEEAYIPFAKSNTDVLYQMISALSKIYDNGYCCDAQQGTYFAFKADHEYNPPQCEDYEKAIRQTVFDLVQPNQRESVLQQLSLHHIKQNLRHKGQTYSVPFYSRFDNNTQCCFEVMFVDSDDQDNLRHFIIGFSLSDTHESEDNQSNRYYEEIHKHVLNENLYRQALLSNSSIIYQVNITKDLIEKEFTQSYKEQELPVLPAVGIHAPCSYDDYCSRWSTRVSDDTLYQYHLVDNCATLLNLYKMNQKYVSVKYRSLDTLNREVFVQKNIIMDCDQDTGDVIALCFLTFLNEMNVADSDIVTGLPNDLEYTKCLYQAILDEKPFTVLKIGIDTFSHINVMYGVSRGNEILKCFSKKIKEIINEDDMLFRLPGVRFSILTRHTNKDYILKLYNRIQEIATREVTLRNQVVPLKLASGAIVISDNYRETTVEAIKSCATYTLEYSKRENHGELVFFDEQSHGSNQTSLELLSMIHQSITDGCKGFYLCYQPIADNETNHIVGMEALIRWKNDKYGVVQPSQFIPWLEEDPSFYKLGEWIIQRALRDAMVIKKTYPHFIINVNVSPSQLESHHFKKYVKNILEEVGFPPEDFVIELTERCRNLDCQFLREQISYFQSLGIQIAMDDFGTGSSSMSMLDELPIDELKVDMSFIKDIMYKKSLQAIVFSIVLCAKKMNVKICLEGVENQELLDYLKQYEPTYYQGYHYSKPVPLEQFVEVLKRGNLI